MLVNMFNNILTINLLKTELFREIGPLYGATFMHEAVIIVSMGGCPCQNNPSRVCTQLTTSPPLAPIKGFEFDNTPAESRKPLSTIMMSSS